MDERPRRVSLHEAAHTVAADAAGWEVGTLTVTGGTALAGCARFTPPKVAGELIVPDLCIRPFMLWPSALRERFEAAVLVPMAGGLAALMLADPAEGRVPDPVAERVTERVAELAAELPPPDEDDLAWAAEAVSMPSHESDDEKIALTVWAMFGRDLASAAGFVAFCEAQCRSLIRAQRDAIERLAEVAAHAGVLSGAAAAELIRDTGDAAA